MKKLKYIIVIVIVVLIAITSLIIIKPYKRYRKGVIEKEITELLNTGKVGKDILSKDGAWYEYARNEDVHNHNIDEFVKWYLDFIERIVELKKTGKGIENLKDFKFKEKEFLDIEGYTNKDIYEEIINYITNEDIEKYNNSTLRNDLISILKRSFEMIIQGGIYLIVQKRILSYRIIVILNIYQQIKKIMMSFQRRLKQIFMT